jgi:hypothetical protein
MLQSAWRNRPVAEMITRRTFLGKAAFLALAAKAWGMESPDDSTLFSMVTINDIHILDESCVPMLETAVDQINSLPEIRCVGVLGDIAYDVKRERFAWAKDTLEGLTMPYKAIPGNHDVIGSGLAYSEYTRFFGERNWVWPVENWYFIGLDSCSGSAGEVGITLHRMRWIKEQLETIPKDRPIALFAHHNFNPRSFRRVRNADRVIDLFSEHRLRLVATGHWHGNMIDRQDGILYTTTACCSYARDNHDFTPFKGFRVFHLGEDSVKTEFVRVKAPV